MAVIKPFRALRPSAESAHLVASVPYDVVNREEAKALAKNNPVSFLRVGRAEIELDEKVNPYSKEVYQKAKENLEKLRKEVPLKVEKEPHFYLYRLIMDGRAQTGITAVFSVDDYDNDVILKHEKTRKEKEDDRTNHIVTTEAQTGPVFLTYRGIKKVNDIVEKIIKSEPLYDFKAVDNIQHTVWIIPEEFSQAIINEIAGVKNLYIADGHHRAASASRARRVKKDQNPQHKGDEEYNYFIGVLFPAEQLKILPYNRVVFSFNGLTKEQFLDKLKENFNIEKSKIKEPVEKLSFGVYIAGEWYLIQAKDAVNKSSSLSKSVSGTLDVSILQEYILNAVLGIEDIRTSKNIDFIGGIRGTQELEKIVDSGKAAAAFSLYPVSVNDLMRISDAGEIMPPKSTWFEPKLRDGLLVHLI
ncbi:MAG: DUF1015 domain-containing protein [Ignavibacteria bacterium]